MKLHRLIGTAAATAVAVVLSGCSTTEAPEETALRTIEDDLTEELAMGPLESECEEAASADEGVSYSCTSTTEDGDVIQWLATVEPEDIVSVKSENVLNAEQLQALGEAGIEAFYPEGAPDDVGFDCGDTPVVLGDDNIVVCSIEEGGEQLSTLAQFTILDRSDLSFEVEIIEG